jgi:predicted DNA-binding protein
MEMLSLQMPDELLKTTRRCAKSLHVSRATYIRCAIERMNRQTQGQLRDNRLTEASKKVREESLASIASLPP